MIYLYNIAFAIDQNGISIIQGLTHRNLEISPPDNYILVEERW